MNLPIYKDDEVVGWVEIMFDFDLGVNMAFTPFLRHVNGEWKIDHFMLVDRTKIDTSTIEERINSIPDENTQAKS